MIEEHHEVLEKRDGRVANWLSRFAELANFLRHIAHKSDDAKGDGHLALIIRATSNSDEQYMLLKCYWKTKFGKPSWAGAHKYRKVSEKEKSQILKLYRAGYSKYKIAKILNRHVSTIYYVIQREEVGK